MSPVGTTRPSTWSSTRCGRLPAAQPTTGTPAVMASRVDHAVGLLGARQDEHVGRVVQRDPSRRWRRRRGARRGRVRSGRPSRSWTRGRVRGVDRLVAHEVQRRRVRRQRGHGVEQLDDPLARLPVGDAEQARRVDRTAGRARAPGDGAASTSRPGGTTVMRSAATPSAASWAASISLGTTIRRHGAPRQPVEACLHRSSQRGRGPCRPSTWWTLPTSGTRRASPRPAAGRACSTPGCRRPRRRHRVAAARMTAGPASDTQRVRPWRHGHGAHRRAVVAGVGGDASVVEETARHPLRVTLGDPDHPQHAAPAGHHDSCSGARRASTSRSMIATTP